VHDLRRCAFWAQRSFSRAAVMDLVTTLNHLQKARKIVADGQRDLTSQRNLVDRMEQNGIVDLGNLLLLEQLEAMQCGYIKHLDKLEHRLLEQLRLE
jgi:hypothetical protein